MIDRHFMLGLPWVGAQVAVYRSLVEQLAVRGEHCWDEWGPDGPRRELARFASERIGRAADWPRPIFVPDDPFVLVAWDHDAVAIDDLGMVSALQEIEDHLGTKPTDDHWNAISERTLVRLVTAMRTSNSTVVTQTSHEVAKLGDPTPSPSATSDPRRPRRT